jgi:hypothetical protein
LQENVGRENAGTSGKKFQLLKTSGRREYHCEGTGGNHEFINKELFAAFAEGFDALSEDERIEGLIDRLNRPLRVCGMVKNEGEPGGGPFLVNMPNGTKSLQIIEGAQIDKDDPGQQEIAMNATHFNPVDIVCSVQKLSGGDFLTCSNLLILTPVLLPIKPRMVNLLKALELPGLWNGAMASGILFL